MTIEQRLQEIEAKFGHDVYGLIQALRKAIEQRNTKCSNTMMNMTIKDDLEIYAFDQQLLRILEGEQIIEESK